MEFATGNDKSLELRSGLRSSQRTRTILRPEGATSDTELCATRSAMKKTTILTSLLVSSVIACASNKSPPESAHSQALPIGESAVTLVIEDAKVIFPAPEDKSDTEHSIELRSTGKAFIDGAHVATLKSDGTVLNAEAKVVAQIALDGSLTFTGEDEAAMISEDGTITWGGRSVSLFHQDGTFRLPQNGRVGNYTGSPRARKPIVIIYFSSMQVRQAENMEKQTAPVGNAPSI